MIKTVIFDMDGVLIDTERWTLTCSQGLLAEQGVRVAQEELLRLTGSPEDVYRAAMAAFLGLPLEEYLPLSHSYFQRHPAVYEELVNPEAVEILSWLQERGYALGLATSDTDGRTRKKFVATGLDRFFPVVVTDEMVTHSKPHPEPYLRVAGALGAEPGHCLVIEDSKRGIAAGHHAGMTVAALRNPLVPQDISLADFCMDRLTDIKTILTSDQKEA